MNINVWVQIAVALAKTATDLKREGFDFASEKFMESALAALGCAELVDEDPK